MAGPTDSDQNRQNTTCPRDEAPRSSYDDENPFIAFRRYADEQISSLLQSMMGLPSTFSPPSRHGWLTYQDDPPTERYRQGQEKPQYGAQRDSYTGQDHHCSSSSNPLGGHDGYDPASHAPERPNNSKQDDIDRARPSQPNHSLHRHSHSFFFDSLQDGPWPIEPFPFSHSFFHPSSPFSEFMDSASWPVPYLLFSPYSPLHLERQRQLRDRDGNGILSFVRSSLHLSQEEQEQCEPPWRDAFEDLIRLENGKGLLDRDTQAAAGKESGKDWLAGLLERGSLGEQWKQVGETDGSPNGFFRLQQSGSQPSGSRLSENQSGLADGSDNRRTSGEDTESLTELDLYDHFLQRSNESAGSDAEESSMTPLLQLIFEEQHRRREELQKQRRQWRRFKDMTPPKSTEVDGEERPRADHTDGRSQEAIQYPMQEEAVPGQSFATWRSADTNTSTDAEFLASANSPSSPDITSTSTSTERRILSDGSIQTKVVRRTCFADGTEESNETVNVLNNPQQPNGPPETDSQEQQVVNAGHATNQSDNSKKGNGWFWKD